MAKKLSLNSIRESIETKYESTFIEIGGGKEVELLNPLRMSDESLREFQKLSNEVSGDDEDQDIAELTSKLEQILKLAAKDEAQGDALIAACGHDRVVLTEVVSGFFEEQEVGEALPSEN